MCKGIPIEKVSSGEVSEKVLQNNDGGKSNTAKNLSVSTSNGTYQKVQLHDKQKYESTDPSKENIEEYNLKYPKTLKTLKENDSKIPKRNNKRSGRSDDVKSVKKNSKSVSAKDKKELTPSTPAKKKQKRTKTFRGCYTCRRRKIACDLGRPVCERCRRSGYVCEGYDVKLRWTLPIEFDRYGDQLPAKTSPECPYFQRRAIDFVVYSDDTAYHYYDEMDKDLAKLHNMYIPSITTRTTILGHFGAFRGVDILSLAPKLRRKATRGMKGSKSKLLPMDGMRAQSISSTVISDHQEQVPGTPRSVTSMSTTTTGSAALNPGLSNSNGSYVGGFNNGNIAPPGNEWLSNELLDAALLTASAINGDTHFLDMLKPGDIKADDIGFGNSANGTATNVDVSPNTAGSNKISNGSIVNLTTPNSSITRDSGGRTNIKTHSKWRISALSKAIGSSKFISGGKDSSVGFPGRNLTDSTFNSQDEQLDRNDSEKVGNSPSAMLVSPIAPLATQDNAQINNIGLVNNDKVSDNMLHLLFQGRNSNMPTDNGSITSISESTSNENANDEQYIKDDGGSTVHTGYSNQNFSRSDKPIAGKTIKIHAGSGVKMPKTIMEILKTNPLPKSLAIDRFGIPTTSLNVQPMARYLLNYYIEDVADMMTVIPLPKNPWKFIYFPRAMMAIGELAATGQTSNARNGLLNALLAVSAFNLQSKFERGSDEMKYYVNLGVQLRQQANSFLNKCLQEDIFRQKYKDVLCAVLSMVTIDVVWGTHYACKIHLDHCEKIIEKKMKVKKKLSPKAIILHRIFSSLKLLQDSTCIDHVSKDEIFLNESNYDKFITGAKPTAEQLEKFFNTHFHDMFKGSQLRRQFAKSTHGSNPRSIQDSFSSIFKKQQNTVSQSRRKRVGKYNERITDNGKVTIEFIMNSDDEGVHHPHHHHHLRKNNDINNADNESDNASTGIVTEESSQDESQKENLDVPAFIGITRSSFQPSKNKLDDKMVSSDAIYGLPNSLILMFSEVVHLTKFKRYHTENDLPIPSFFEGLTMQLEYKLLTWKLEWKLAEADEGKSVNKDDDSKEDNNANNADETLNLNEKSINQQRNFISPRHEGIYHHVMSFYYGLIIYFYRFVEDMNPMYLQDKVEKVLRHLNAIQEILQKHPETSYIIPLFWQGFMAGSEAMTVYLQNGFNLWGQHIAQTGIGTYWNARQIMMEIWRRKNHNVKNNTWVDVLRDWKTNVMLT